MWTCNRLASACFVLSFLVHASALVAQTVNPLVITPLVDLESECQARTNEQGMHGGTQSRVCRTSHGTYIAYIGPGEREGDRSVIHLVRVRHSIPTLLMTRETDVSSSNSVHVVCDADEHIYVLAPGSAMHDGVETMLLTAYHLDPKDDHIDEYAHRVPFGAGTSFGYSAVGLTANKQSAITLYSGGDAPGFFGWCYFDFATKAWSDHANVAEIPFRHCYNYCFPTEYGMMIVSERDVRAATLGIAPGDKRRKVDANYVWDELRVFRFGSGDANVYEAFDIESAVYDMEAHLFPTVSNNWRGDAFVDADKNLHVLYLSDDNNRQRGSFNRHKVFTETGELLATSDLPFQDASALRMVQTIDAETYILSIPYASQAKLSVWRVTRSTQLSYELVQELTLSEDLTPQYPGISISSPRNGSLQDNRVDCILPANGRYHYFQIQF